MAWVGCRATRHCQVAAVHLRQSGGVCSAAPGEQQWSPTINGLDFQIGPKIEGHIWGLQAGVDLVGFEHQDGAEDRIGLFYTHTEASGDITGYTLARPNNSSGELNLSGDSIAAYWTHLGAPGWYVDTVGMVTWLNGDATSNRGIGADLGGNCIRRLA